MVAEVIESPWQAGRERQQQRVAKKDAVLLTAARMFTARGFQGTSLDDIAHSLSVTKPTLYHYIANKDEILFECVKRGLAALRSGIQTATQQGLPGRERLRAAMENYATIVTSDFGLCVIRVGEDPLSEPKRRELRALKGEIDVEFRVLVQQGMDEGWVATGDAAMAAHTVVAALSGIGRWYHPENHTDDNLRDAVQHCIAMLMRGVLCAPADLPRVAVAAAEASTPWGRPMPAMRRELHFGQRVVRCFAQRPTSVGQMLADAVTSRPDAEALVVGELRLSWRELHHAASKCAASLVQRGVRPGDRVALYLGNSAEFVIACFACAWMGAVAVPISARARAAELAYTLVDAAAVALVAAPELLEFVPAPELAPELVHRFVVGAGQQGFEPFAVLMQADPLTQACVVAEEDLAVLLYTSGTTGRPKGAMLSHLNIVHSVMNFAEVMSLGTEERSIVAAPMSHVTGLVELYLMLYCKGCSVLMTQFKAADFVRLAASERMTHTIMVPAMYNLCLLLPDLQAHDLSHWRIGAFGGSAMPTASIESLAQRLPGLTLINAYGATETCSPATIMPRGATDTHRDCVGLPVPCGEIGIFDEAGHELPRGQVGEIWIAGPMIVRGYWRNEAATESEFCGGYWRSGDIGSMDAEGFVRVLDRAKDVINRGGYKIFCAQVENALAEHRAVIEVALVGVPCAVLGERVHAFVCVQALDDSTLTTALQAFCAARVSDYAVPETWTIGTEPLPRNLNGKIMKRELRQTLHTALT